MRRVAWAGLIGTALLLSLAGVAAAKEGAEASLDAPIPPGAEPGSEIEVGWSAGWPDGTGGLDPIIGSPVFIRLTSVDGSEKVEASGTERPSGSGHYVATITVPRGGVGLVEIGLRGESCVNGECFRSDIPFVLSDVDRLPQLGAPRASAPEAQAPAPIEPANAQPLPTAPATSMERGGGVPIAITAMALAGLGALAFVVRRRRPLAGRA
jgi:MYXO-CTERM domain-containing protein